MNMRRIITIVEGRLLQERSFPVEPWRWTEEKSFEYVAKFLIDKVTYEVSIFQFDSTIDGWLLSFGAATKEVDFGHSKSNTGNAWKVFGTVVAIAVAFAKMKSPKVLKIESDTTERSRLAVNRRIAAAAATEMDYTMSEDKQGTIVLTSDKSSSTIHRQ